MKTSRKIMVAVGFVVLLALVVAIGNRPFRPLVDSGYLTNLTIPVPDLKPQVLQVLGVLSNTSAQAQAYAQWTLETHQDQVRLLCRTQDLALWRETLAPFNK